MNFNHSPQIKKKITTRPTDVAFLNNKTIFFFTCAALVLTFFSSSPSLGVEPGEILQDPKLEARARDLSRGLRCVVCQNQSIDDSNAGLARDMRILVRERIIAGDSDAQVTKYIVSRYGDYVLLNPPLKSSTYALWFGPLIILGLGLLSLIIFFRRGKKSKMASLKELNDTERRRIEAMLEDENIQ